MALRAQVSYIKIFSFVFAVKNALARVKTFRVDEKQAAAPGRRSRGKPPAAEEEEDDGPEDVALGIVLHPGGQAARPVLGGCHTDTVVIVDVEEKGKPRL